MVIIGYYVVGQCQVCVMVGLGGDYVVGQVGGDVVVLYQLCVLYCCWYIYDQDVVQLWIVLVVVGFGQQWDGCDCVGIGCLCVDVVQLLVDGWVGDCFQCLVCWGRGEDVCVQGGVVELIVC